MKFSWYMFIKITVAVIFIISIIYMVDFNKAYNNIIKFGSFNFLSYFFLSLITVLFHSIRLHALILNYTEIFKNTVSLTIISQFFNSFLPGGVSGDIYKIFYLKKKKVSISGATSLILLDRLIGLFWVLFFGGLYLLISPSINLNLKPQYLNSGLFLLGVFSIFFIFFVHRNIYIKTKIQLHYNDIKKEILLISKYQKIAFILISPFPLLVRVLKFYMIILMFNHSLDYMDVLIIIIIIQIAMIIPMSIGGVGILEASLVYGLGLFGIPNEIGLAIAIINRIVVWIIAILGGVLWVSLKKNQSIGKLRVDQ